MQKNKLLIIFMALIFVCTLSVLGVVIADDADCFVEVDLELSSPSILGNDINVIATVWTSLDGTNWSKDQADEFSTYCELVYYSQQEDVLSDAPSAIGSYVARYKVKDNVKVPERFRNGNKLVTSGMVLATFTYDIVYQDFQVIFYPEGDTTYSDGINFYSKITGETKPYLGGIALSESDYVVAVYKDSDTTPINEISGPGEYTVCVTIKNAISSANISEGQQFTSTFFLTNELNNFAYINQTFYEGMYSTQFAPSESKSDVEEMAVEYYTPKLEGIIGTLDSGCYDVCYFEGNGYSSNPPRTAGEYYVRISFKSDVDKYDLKEGDFIDVSYQIKSKPYTVEYTYNSNAPDQNNGFLVQANGTKLSLSFKNLSGESLSILSERTSIRYFYYNSDGQYEEMTAGAVPTVKGLYRALITLSASEENSISGKSYFGNSDGDYKISSSLYNNVWSYDFQIIPTVKVQNILTEYTYGESISISPLIKYSGASMDSSNYVISYYDKEMNSVEWSAVNEEGTYFGIISFIADWAPFGDIVVTAGDCYLFSFEIVLPQANPTLEEVNGNLIFKVNGKTPVGFSVNYYRYENNLCYSASQDTLLNRVGTYKAVYTFTSDNKSLGISAGDVITMSFEKKASGALSDIYFGVKEAYALDGVFYTDYNSNIFYATLTFDEDSIVDSQIKERLNYSVHYERYDDGVPTICGYPLLPGKYKAVLLFHEASAEYGVNAGDGLTFIFEINPIKLTAEFTVLDDLVYSGEEKSFSVTFKANGRPLEVDSQAYLLASAVYQSDTAEYSDFSERMPENASSYRLSAVFIRDGYEKYGLEKFAFIDGCEYEAEELIGSAVFSEKITIEKLRITVLVGIPVEERGMYHLDESAVNATYSFYKSNGVSDFDEGLNSGNVTVLSDSVVSLSQDFNIKYLCSPLNSISAQEEVVDNSVKTSRYKLEIKMKDGVQLYSNAVIDNVCYYYDGAKEGVEYDSGIYFASNGTDGLSFSVGYQISPLPLFISLPQSLSGELYYGSAKAVDVSEMVFETYDLSRPDSSLTNGERYERLSLSSYDFYKYFDARYYNRKTGSDVINGEPLQYNGSVILGNDYIFSAGDYMLSLVVNDNYIGEEVEKLFSYFTINGGLDEQYVSVNGKPMAVGDIKNIRLTVNSAKVIRAVFERDFDTFVYDGNAKKFNIVFYYGDSILTNSELDSTSYTVKFFDSNESTLENPPTKEGKYSIVITFNGTNYKYIVRQLEGEYIPYDNQYNVPYILGGSTIQFDFEIISPINLGWSWYIDNEKLDYDSYRVSDESYASYVFNYTNTQKTLQLRFFEEESGRPVNLIKNTDYAIWYYEVKSENVFTKLDSEPSKVGEYIAEIVFLRTLHDYRAKYDNSYKTPYAYTEAEENNGFGKSLAFGSSFTANLTIEGRYFSYEIKPSDLLISGFNVSDKQFDNSDNAEFTFKPKFVILDEGAIVSSDIDNVQALLDLTLIARFEDKNVKYEVIDGNFTVLPMNISFLIYVQEGCEIKLPDIDMLGNGNKANSFILEQIEDKMSSAKGELFEKLTSLKAIVDRISCAYNIVVGQMSGDTPKCVQGKIIRRVVTITPDSFERTYDPFFVDSNELTWTTDIPNELSDFVLAKDFYSGTLAREGQGEKNDVGNYTITLGTLSCNNANFRLVLSSSRVVYTITPVSITVRVVDSALSKYYDEEDPEFECELKEGTLIQGDLIDYKGDCSPTRESKKSIDDVGFYPLNLKNIRIVNSVNANVSSNYYIKYEEQSFEIKVRSIFVTPSPYKNGDYSDDFYSLYDLNPSSGEKRYKVEFENDGGIIVDYQFKNGDYLYGRFGLEPSNIGENAKTYKITLGTITVRNEAGKDVGDNYSISQNTKNAVEYTIRKKTVILVVAEDAKLSKVFGEEDPIIKVKLYSGSSIPDGYTIDENSTAGRKTGEDVGSYEILNSNENGGIRILDANKNDVTEYFNITVNVGDAIFEIEQLEIYVSVNSNKTYLKGDNSIKTLVFKDETNKTISKEIIEGSKLTSYFKINHEFVEGENKVTPEVVMGSEDKLKNFNYHLVEGTVTLVYPENTVYVSAIDSEEQIAVKNKNIFYKATLYRTLQMYSLKTGNGQAPTKYVEVAITIPEELYNQTVQVLAVHSDGSIVKLDATSQDGQIIISDNDFKYIMICSVETWPYYLIIGGVVLVIAGLIGVILRAFVRKKRRGGEKKRNFAKEGTESKKNKTSKKDSGEKVELSSGMAPTGDGKKEYIDDEDLYASSVKSAESDKKSKKKKVKKDNPEAHTTVLGGARPSGGAMPGGAVPGGAKPSAEATRSVEDDSIDLDIDIGGSSSVTPSSHIDLRLGDDEEIVISGASRGEESTSSIAHDGGGAFGSDDDDEIIITSGVRRGED